MSEDLLTVELEKLSPLKTITKNLNLEDEKIKNLTYSLPLTSDQIFKIFDIESTLSKILLLNNEGDVHDNKCAYQKNDNKNHYSQRCKGCQILYRLRKGKTSNTSDIIEILTGKNKGIKIKITSNFFFKESKHESEKYYLKNKLITNKISNIFSKKLYDNKEFIHFDNKNYNYVVQSIIFNQIMRDEKTEYRNNYLWSYICGHNLKILEKDKIINNLQELINNPIFSISNSPTIKQNEKLGISKTSIVCIIRQLIIIFKLLSKYEYIHGNPDISYINYSLSSISFKFKDKYQNFPFSLILQNSGFTSTTYDQKRYFCSNDKKFKNSSIPFEKISIYINDTKNYFYNPNYPDYYNQNRIYSYKIGNQLENFTQLRNFYGVPLCHDSFDFVVFLVGFVIDNNFIHFKECKEFIVWKGLWMKDEYPNLMKDLEKLKENNYESIIDTIKKYHIRFDAVEYFYQSILELSN